jgi:radical SAM superfamily enzyme YgiQ (UPF0313 family)
MKIVLVNPPLTIEERYGVHFQSGGQTPPLGLASLAATLEESHIGVRIIDGAVNNDYQDVTRRILGERPNYVGITASTVSIYNAAKIAQMVKDENPSITVIIGGPHITAVPIETMERFADFDIGVIGESEHTIVELLTALENKGDLATVKGIVYRGHGIIRTDARPYIEDLDSLPMPAWHLLPDLTKYYCPPVHTVKRLPATLMVTSRGCPAKCKFCDRSVFGNHSRANSAEYVLGMMRILYHKYGIREFQFRDDNFLAFRTRLVELCGLIKEERMDIAWSLAGRIDMVNPDILALLHEAGCWQIWYGIESGSQRVLDFINKRTRLDMIRQAIRWTNDAGIDACGFFMMGIPTETRDDIEKTLRFSRELGLREAHFTFFTPFPGCELYNNVVEYGSFDDDWRKTSCWSPVFVPKGISKNQLIRYWKEATMRFYLRPRVVLNYFRRMRSLKHIKIYLSGLLALLEAVVVKKYAGGR